MTGDSRDMAIADPVTVYTAHNAVEADTVRIFLEQEGIRADADTGQIGILRLLFSMPTRFPRRRVWVPRRDEHWARQLLAEYDGRPREGRGASRVDPSVTAGRVMVVCEECGRTSWFPAEQQGSTQECPFCYAFVDVGGAEPAVEPSPSDSRPSE